MRKGNARKVERAVRFFLIKLPRGSSSLFSFSLLIIGPRYTAGTSTNDAEHFDPFVFRHRAISAHQGEMHRENQCGLTGKNRTIRMRPRFRVSPVALSRLVKIYWPSGHCVLRSVYPFLSFYRIDTRASLEQHDKSLCSKMSCNIVQFFYLPFRIKVHRKVDKFCRHGIRHGYL